MQFKIMNKSKKNLILKDARGNQKNLVGESELVLSEDEYKAYQKSLASFRHYVAVMKEVEKAEPEAQPEPEVKAEPEVEESKEDAPAIKMDEAELVEAPKKKVSKKVTKKKASRKTRKKS